MNNLKSINSNSRCTDQSSHRSYRISKKPGDVAKKGKKRKKGEENVRKKETSNTREGRPFPPKRSP